MNNSHSRIFYQILSAEALERTIFFAFRAMIVLFLTHHFQLDEKLSILTLYTFICYSYLTPLIGGMIADKYNNHLSLSLTGIITTTVGAACFIFPHPFMVSVGLACIITGSGMYKTNLLSSINKLYPDQGVLREDAFTKFYSAVAIGLLIGSAGIGIISATISWRAGFITLTLIGFLASCLLMNIKRALSHLDSPTPMHLRALLFPIIGLQIIVFSILISRPRQLEPVLIGITLTIISYFSYTVYKQPRHIRSGLYTAIIVAFITTAFLAFSEQTASSIILYLDHHVDLRLWGKWELPPQAVLGLEPILFVLLAGCLHQLTSWLQKRGRPLNIYHKLSLGYICMIIAFSIFAVMTYPMSSNGPLASIIFVIIFIAIGELIVLPASLEITAHYAPPQAVSATVACFLTSYVVGNLFAAHLAEMYTVLPSGGQLMEIAHHDYFSLSVFIIITSSALAILTGIIGERAHLKKKRKLP